MSRTILSYKNIPLALYTKHWDRCKSIIHPSLRIVMSDSCCDKVHMYSKVLDHNNYLVKLFRMFKTNQVATGISQMNN